MHATTVAVDLAKDVFELAFADADGRIIERKRLSRNAFSRCLANRPPLRVVHDHGIGHGPEAGNADNNSGQEGRLNDGHSFAAFMMARAPRCAALIEKPDTRMQPFRVADDQERSCDR